jgi:glucans biosynthesis protein C
MNRRYDLDWLRVIAFGILMLFHTGMGFTSYDWHVKNYESSPLIDELIQFVHQWRMPLLFFISGAAVWFAMEKYSAWRYLGERQKRLLLPLVFGMLVVIPPQVYCERVYQREGYASFFDFYPTIFTSGSYNQGNLSWHHLWYIPYIWAFSMITFPVFAWFKSKRGRSVIAKFQSLFTRPGALFFIFIPSALAEIALRPYYPGDACSLLGDWANFTHKLAFFVIGFTLASGTVLADVIAARRRHYLLGAIGSLIVLEFAWTAPFRIPSVPYRCLSNFHAWMWILAALGFGRQYLNVNSSSLRYATNAVYPFYILHQTVIVMLLLPLVYVNLGLWTKYFIVLAGTVLITWGLYEGLISRVNVLRVCFGLKARLQKRSVQVEGAPDLTQPGRGLAIPPGSGPVAASLLVACATLGLTTPALGSGKVMSVLLNSPSLASNRLGIAQTQPVAVYLPPSYASGERRYSVIYLLPNFNTPVWRYTAGNYQGFRLRQAADRLSQAGTIPETIVVIPNTLHFLGSSWYRNSSLTGNWEDFITRDLVGYMDSHFRTIARRQARGVAGHAVGGTGALELALKHPDVFGAVYAMSPAILSGDDVRTFTADGDGQADSWRALTVQWSRLDEKAALKAFRLYMQDRLNTFAQRAQFEGLRVSYAAAAAPSISTFPHVDFPLPDSRDEAARERFWADIMGDWEAKLKAYLACPNRLARITIEYGRQDQYEFIRRGAEHVSQVMRSLGVPNNLTVSDGGHDSTLGRRFEAGMLPSLANAIRMTD